VAHGAGRLVVFSPTRHGTISASCSANNSTARSDTLATTACTCPPDSEPSSHAPCVAGSEQFAAKGVTLAQADCLIAATAHSSGATLATANVRDFPMPGLRVEGWPTD
jgi:hypothetical protein